VKLKRGTAIPTTKKEVILFTLYALTFLVALCSIVYELIFSQLLTILFGGTAKRYAITIGVYLFFLGVGSLLYERIKYDKKVLFIVMELLITAISTVGAYLLVKGYTFSLHTSMISGTTLLWLSYIPISLVGFISGMEIPLLMELASTFRKKQTGIILGIDYLGSLVGTILFALLLFPEVGIFAALIIIAFLNILAACVVSFLPEWCFSKGLVSRGYKKLIRVLQIVGVVILVLYSAFLLLPSQDIQDNLIKEFRGGIIFSKYYIDGELPFDAEITEVSRTIYQDISFADIKLDADDPEDYSLLNYTCMFLDNDLQMCEEYVLSYHGGLIDFPMQFLNDKHDSLNVLLIGGGDWIPQYNLLEFSQVTHIDQGQHDQYE
jgi:spermidine synthase